MTNNQSPSQRQHKTSFEAFGKEHGRGWDAIVDPLIEQANKEGALILQVKEKFGGLRFYVSRASAELQRAIEEAEKKCYQTCETCGKPGVLRSGGWIRTLCDEHAEGRKEMKWPE